MNEFYQIVLEGTDMAIPKMKIYRLDQNYSPDNDTDLKSVTDDEAYPFVEKSLDLNVFEQLVGVTYRDLIVGKSISVDAPRLLSMYSEDEGLTYDRKKTEWVSCNGWKKGRNALQIQISDDNGTSWSSVLDESYYRVNYSNEDRLYDASGNVVQGTDTAVAKRKDEILQIEFGELIYLDGVNIEDGKSITNVRVGYSLFSSDINTSGGELALERGNIYDGTISGRLGILAGSGYTYKADENGFPLKAEGNIGYKIKVYPCRQKVAQMDDLTDSVWAKDVSISPTGSITLENCEDWIVTLTDERHPRVFELVNLNGHNVFRELVLNEQYTLTSVPKDNGRKDFTIQLSQDYYNIAYGVYVYPKELFIRYNEEIDILEDVFSPEYLNYDNDVKNGDTGILTSSLSTFDVVHRKIFRMAISASFGYEDGRDFLLSGNDSEKTIDLNSIGYDGILSTVSLYCGGKIFYQNGTNLSNSDFNVSTNGYVLTITPKEGKTLPNTILVSYKEKYSVGFGKEGASDQNHWACGFRICCYEKTKSAKEFVSSFRNWVSDHLNNNPDIFRGWQEYEGSSENNLAISFLESGYSILYREGAITFPENIDTNDFNDIRNFPPAGATVNLGTPNSSLKKYLNQVYAKFAYYDGIFDVTNALLREFEVDSGAYKYALIDDPTYPNAENKRWIIRNDDKMPITFFHKNQYLPTPNYVETGECELYTAFSMNDGEILVMNLSDYREVAIKNNIDTPDNVIGLNGDTMTRSFTIVWDQGRTESTAKVNDYAGDGVFFKVTNKYTKSQNVWNLDSSSLYRGNEIILTQLFSRTFDSRKTLAENIAARPRYTHSTNEGTPFNVVFETGENNLLIFAEKK